MKRPPYSRRMWDPNTMRVGNMTQQSHRERVGKNQSADFSRGARRDGPAAAGVEGGRRGGYAAGGSRPWVPAGHSFSGRAFGVSVRGPLGSVCDEATCDVCNWHKTDIPAHARLTWGRGT